MDKKAASGQGIVKADHERRSIAAGSVMQGKRHTSVDAFRWITVVLMIGVNNPRSWSHVHAPLRHAPWHGLLPADLVFPFFLFIAGVSIELSLRARADRSENRIVSALHILKRAALLFALGLFLNGFPFYPFERLAQIRIPGVLQRIALVYAGAAFLRLYGGLGLQAAVLALLLGGYWALLTLVPVPGAGQPSLDPGTNLAAWLDRLLLDGHLWKVTRTWDPEGILSSLSALSTAILGLWAGRMLFAKDGRARTLALIAGGTVLIALGCVWHHLYPINKGLWTGSYVLVTAGIAALFLVLLRWIIDVRDVKGWSLPFVIMGANALAAFVLSSILARTCNVVQVPVEGMNLSLQSYLYGYYVVPHLDSLNASLAWALAMAGLCFPVMALLYRKRIFIRM
jgi:predicted acyltransferase